MNVSASFDVKMGSGSSLKYCFNMSAMSYGDKPSKSVLSTSWQKQQVIMSSFIVSGVLQETSYRSSFVKNKKEKKYLMVGSPLWAISPHVQWFWTCALIVLKREKFALRFTHNKCAVFTWLLSKKSNVVFGVGSKGFIKQLCYTWISFNHFL